MAESDLVKPRIRTFISQTFPAARKRTIDDEVPLLESGIIDSLGVLDVVGFLEKTFAIKVDDDELTPDNFGNIRCMASFVEQKKGQAEVSVR